MVIDPVIRTMYRRRREKKVNFKVLLVFCMFLMYFVWPNTKKSVLLRGSSTLAVNLIGCDRTFQFELALRSLAKAAERGNYKERVIVYASVDCLDEPTMNMVKYWEKNMRSVLNVVYVESYQMRAVETEEQAKKLDERVARHWLSSTNRVFERGYDNVIYMESDHVVSPDFFEAAEALIKFTDSYCPKCFMMNLGCHDNCLGNYHPGRSKLNELAIYPLQNIGVVYRRAGWEKFMRNVNLFCDILGDWDVNMNTLLALGIEDVDPRSPGYTVPRVFHTSTCYTSRRKSMTKNCRDPDSMHQAEYNSFVSRFDNVQRRRDPLVLTNSINRKGPGRKWPADYDTKRRCLESVSRIF